MKEVVPYCPDYPKGPKTENHVGNCAQNPSVYYFVSSAQVTVFCCLLHSATLCNGRRRRFRRTLYNVVHTTLTICTSMYNALAQRQNKQRDLTCLRT